ncbi:hypothetical protein FHS55_001585 [Angulomicrobium tetraedrale]|uniref:Uncharacterized protein n=1 Tax=Ancylobacter tetraedralis TaxID=217068 RepID=A0A839Z853_9HYPH|nr:hypothetical protein [Ancylobacter tetraedralis]MBB3770990.1 hypothetical protein [Ancylobacter tetraedralis]
MPVSLTARRLDRSAIMRAAVAYARELIERERSWYFTRYSAEIRYGSPRPAMKLPTWRAAMAHGLRLAWAEARKSGEAAPVAPAVKAELASIELGILSVHCAERITRTEAAHLASLTARAAELHAMSRAAVAHAL